MQIIQKNAVIPISQLQNWKDNPRSIQKKDFERLKSQIKELGIYKPLLVSKNGNGYDVIGGNMRLRALKELGFNKADCWILRFKNKQEKIKLSLSDNDRAGYYDDQALAELIYPFKDEISLEDFKVDLKIPDIDLGNILDRFAPENEKDDEVPEVRKTKIKLGDLFQIGNHRLLCGDATKRGDVERLMDGKKANMVFTDPPYGLGGYAGRSGKFNAMKGDNEDIRKFYNYIPIVAERYIFGNYQGLKLLSEEPRDVIVWKKNNLGMGRGYRNQYELCFYYGSFAGSDSDVWEINKDIHYRHPTQKPIALCVRALINSSKQGDIIWDGFGGSGSTLIACEKLNRRCYMMEIEPIYCQVIIDRWENYTGNKVKKIEQ